MGKQDRHVLPVALQVVRGLLALAAIGAIVTLLVLILKPDGIAFDGYDVAGLAYAAASVNVVYVSLRRYESDGYFIARLLIGSLPGIAAYLTLSGSTNVNLLVVLSLLTIAVGLVAFVLEMRGKGRWVAMWRRSDWEWTLLPRLKKP